ncbi:MAG: RIP metalloprotease RseP [Bdellovibrionales bacterium]|nr:RIP metalloprotease RseP [Bdellovibrionales bacterium]
MEVYFHMVETAQFIQDNIIPFFLLLGVLIFVHELGHFSVAKFFGVRVETFSIGFGKKILSFKKGDTTYALSLFPLGGYVKMYGDNPEAEVPEDQKKYSFLHKPVSQRFAIVFAGPFINFAFAAILFAFIAMIGEQVPAPVVGDIDSSSQAYQMGFRSGDKIQTVNNKTIDNWMDLERIIKENPNETINVSLLRDGEELELAAKTTQGKNKNILSLESDVGTITGLHNLATLPVVGVAQHGVGAKNGLKTFDEILAVNETPVLLYSELKSALEKAANSNEAVNLTVKTFNDPAAKERSISIASNKLDSSNVLNSLGVESTELYIYRIQSDSPAEKAGLKAGDKLLEIDGQPLNEWEQVIEVVRDFNPEDKYFEFIIYREGKKMQFDITPQLSENLMTATGSTEDRYTIGVSPAFFQTLAEKTKQQTLNPLKAAWIGIEDSVKWSGMILVSIWRLIDGTVSAKNIGGVISIGRFSRTSFEEGISAFIKMMAILSINLFLLNLLPIPVLDGGHLVFFSIEALKGSPISLKKMEIAQTVGFILLMSLMVFSLYNDVTNYLQSLRW